MEYPVVRPKDLVFDLVPGTHSLQVFRVPFHFAWHWHSGTPDPEQLPVLDRPNGSIDVAHNTGTNGDRQVSHHAGFGISLNTDHPKNVTGRSLRRTTYSYGVGAGFPNGSATAEGGMEMTVVENGTLIRFAEDKIFRKRVSVNENDGVELDGFVVGDPIEVSWTMLPGSRYEFNVGAWVYGETDQPTSPDASIARERMLAQVIAMTIEET